MKTCVFAGTFDPITKGHEYVINKCLEMFDKVIVAVGINVAKKPLFTLNQRMDLIKENFKDNDRVVVSKFDGMLTAFMNENNVKINVRGIRNQDDYKYETTMANYNRDMKKDIITIFIPTPPELSYVSSSGVRNIIELNSDFDKYVPDRIKDEIKEMIKK